MLPRLIIFLLSFIYLQNPIFSANIDLTSVNSKQTKSQSLEIKYSYRKAKDSKRDFESFNDLVSKLPNSRLKEAYSAALLMLSSKFERNPFVKISRFKEGRAKLEELIEESSNSLELRYIRLAIQLNTPKLLSYGDNIEEDKEFILNEISSSEVIDPGVKDYLKDFLRRYELFL